MAATLPVGQWSWHERWLYPSQIYDLPDRPRPYVLSQSLDPKSIYERAQIRYQQQIYPHRFKPTPPQQPDTQTNESATLNATAAAAAAANNTTPPTTTTTTTNASTLPVIPTLPLASLNASPLRYRDGTFKRCTSEYSYSFRAPSDLDESLRLNKSVLVTGPLAGSRVPLRNRGRLRAPANCLASHQDNDLANMPDEQRSFRLWGRINPMHSVMPYQSETQRSFALITDDKDPVERAFFLKVEAKDYKDALVKAKQTQVLRGMSNNVKR